MTSQRRVHRKLFILLISLAVLSVVGTSCNKDRSVKQEMEETGRDIGRGTKKVGRDIKDKSCELVDGKMQCAGEKIKHSIQNTSDKVEDAID